MAELPEMQIQDKGDVADWRYQASLFFPDDVVVRLDLRLHGESEYRPQDTAAIEACRSLSFLPDMSLQAYAVVRLLLVPHMQHPAPAVSTRWACRCLMKIGCHLRCRREASTSSSKTSLMRLRSLRSTSLASNSTRSRRPQAKPYRRCIHNPVTNGQARPAQEISGVFRWAGVR
jgi:hypothetical protein